MVERGEERREERERGQESHSGQREARPRKGTKHHCGLQASQGKAALHYRVSRCAFSSAVSSLAGASGSFAAAAGAGAGAGAAPAPPPAPPAGSSMPNKKAIVCQTNNNNTVVTTARACETESCCCIKHKGMGYIQAIKQAIKQASTSMIRLSFCSMERLLGLACSIFSMLMYCGSFMYSAQHKKVTRATAAVSILSSKNPCPLSRSCATHTSKLWVHHQACHHLITKRAPA